MRVTRLVPFALLLGVAVACGSNFSTGGRGNEAGAGSEAGAGNEAGNAGDPVDIITLEELPAKYSAALCAVFTSCAGDLLAMFRPGEDCLTTMQVTVAESFAPLQGAVRAGRVRYHPEHAQACLDDVAASGCSGLDRREPASCQLALEGRAAADADCTIDAECAGEQYCKVASACPGKCAAYELAGSECSRDDHCASGLACDDNGHCVAPSKEGELCRQGEPDCASGLLCLGEDSDAGTPGKCYPIADALKGELGDACTLETLCQAGLACEISSSDLVDGECVAKVSPGAACHAAIPDECPDDQYCKLAAGPLTAGVCTAKPMAGEACAAGLGTANICAPYTRCDAGLCREIAHAGEDCHADDTCYSGHCVGNACVTDDHCD
jgi:Dickkopf-like protein